MEQAAIQVLAGVIVSIATSSLVWLSLPRGGEVSRFVGTVLEPFVSVAFCAGFALAFIMVVSGVIGFLGGR